MLNNSGDFFHCVLPERKADVICASKGKATLNDVRVMGHNT